VDCHGCTTNDMMHSMMPPLGLGSKNNVRNE
jgi:hypothetical protein